MDSKATPLAASTGPTEATAHLEVLLRRIEARLERLEEAVQPLVQARAAAPALTAMAIDMLDETMARAAADGVELERLFESTKTAVLRMVQIAASPGVKAIVDSGILDSGLFDPDALTTRGLLARAVVDARNQPPRRVGLVGAVMAARQPSVQRALGFLLTVAENLGVSLESNRKLLPPGHGTSKSETTR